MNSKVTTVVLAGAMLLGSAFVASAQDRPQRGQDRGQQDRGQQRRGNIDPAQARERMVGFIRDRLDIENDEEWEVIGPKLEAVFTAQAESRGGGGMGAMMRMGRGGDQGGRDQGGRDQADMNEVQKAAQGLQESLQDEATDAAAIKESLDAYRQARNAARQDLAKKQAELKELLNQRQEAQLVMMGMLE